MIRILFYFSTSFFLFQNVFSFENYSVLLKKYKPKSYQSNTGHSLSYYHLENIDKPVIVISPGYSEPAAKYLMLLEELGKFFEVYIIDHRGQGLSERLSNYKYVSYLDHFDNFVDDFEIFTNKFIKPLNRNKFLIAHSMGALIATKYLIKNSKNPYSRAVLSAPMFEINISPIPKFTVPIIFTIIDSLNLMSSPIMGKGDDTKRGPFESNRVTSSRKRWQAYRDLLLEKPEMALNSMTWKWMKENIDATDAFQSETGELKTPMLILQAQNERVVVNEAQNKFCSNQKKCQLKVISKSKHEMFFEARDIRAQALGYLLKFLSNE